MLKTNNLYRAVVTETANGQFALRLDKKQTVTVARKFLPQEIAIGDELIVEFYTKKQFANRQKNLAQAILREILGE